MMPFVGCEGTVKTDRSIAEEAWCSGFKWIKWLVNGAAEVDIALLYVIIRPYVCMTVM